MRDFFRRNCKGPILSVEITTKSGRGDKRSNLSLGDGRRNILDPVLKTFLTLEFFNAVELNPG